MFTFTPDRNGRPRRAGATILEVMFAIGVLLFGLVGIAAVIPAAGKLARNSIDYTRGVSVATNAATLCQTHGLNDLRRLCAFDDAGATYSVAAGPNLFLCVDPLFASTNGPLASIPQQNYQPRSFPYYDNTIVGSRMVRCSLLPYKSGSVPISPKLAERISYDMDQLSFFQPKDKSLFPSQVYSSSSAADFIPGVRNVNPVYSWFLTMHSNDGRNATASIVIVKSRDLLPPDPRVSSPNKISERVAMVTSGQPRFRGGAGGRITLAFPGVAENEMRSGSWVMLMQEVPKLRHAWYRVVQTASPVDPANPAIVQCSVQGPDWDFTNPTTAAIVENVVAAIEFPMNLVTNN